MVPLILASTHHDVAPVFVAPLILFVVLFAFMAMAIKALICCKIFAKAGYCWALGLLMLVPIADIIMAFVLGFSTWPVQRELRLLRNQQRT